MSVDVKSHLRDIVPYLSYDIYFAYDYYYQLGTLQNVEFLIDVSYRPILRPMSDLCRVITSRGKTFVPIVEISKLLGFDRSLHMNGAGKACFTVADSDNDALYDCIFEWDADAQAFITRCPSFSGGYHIVDHHMSVPVLGFLHEHLFDYRGLIPAGVGVDINTIDMYSITFTYDYVNEC